MPNYLNGKIYRVIDNTKQVSDYIGSTTVALSTRLAKHVNCYVNSINNVSVNKIIENNDYRIMLIENWPCNNKDELRMREQFHIDRNEVVNQIAAFQSVENRKEYMKNYIRDMDKKHAGDRAYYQRNKERLNKYQKEYTEKNKEKVDARQKTVIICGRCGETTNKRNKARHEKSIACTESYAMMQEMGLI
jgi:hypothetical protein